MSTSFRLWARIRRRVWARWGGSGGPVRPPRPIGRCNCTLLPARTLPSTRHQTPAVKTVGQGKTVGQIKTVGKHSQEQSDRMRTSKAGCGADRIGIIAPLAPRHAPVAAHRCAHTVNICHFTINICHFTVNICHTQGKYLSLHSAHTAVRVRQSVRRLTSRSVGQTNSRVSVLGVRVSGIGHTDAKRAGRGAFSKGPVASPALQTALRASLLLERPNRAEVARRDPPRASRPRV